MPGRSTSGFRRLGRHCLHQARSAVRCSASRMKGEPLPCDCEALFVERRQTAYGTTTTHTTIHPHTTHTNAYNITAHKSHKPRIQHIQRMQRIQHTCPHTPNAAHTTTTTRIQHIYLNKTPSYYRTQTQSHDRCTTFKLTVF